MNMISTGAFQTEMDASNKQQELVKKLTAAWEKKNSKAARAGGVSLMALTLAACGDDDDTPFSQADVDAAVAASEADFIAEINTAIGSNFTGDEDSAVILATIAASDNAPLETAAAEALVAQAAAEEAAAAALVAQLAAQEDAAEALVAQAAAEADAATALVAQAAAEADLATAREAAATATTAKETAEASLAAAQNDLIAKTAQYDNLVASNNTLQANYDALVAPTSAALTSATAADNLVGSVSGDTFTGTFGTGATLTTGDTIIDSTTTDSDTLTLTGAAFGNSADTSIAIFRNIETVNVVFDTLTNATIDAAGIASAATISASNVRAGSGAALTVTNITDGSTLNVSDFNTVTNATADAGGDLTLNANAATTNVRGTTSGDGNLTVNAAAATGTVRGDSATGSVTIDAAAATVLTANSTSGDISVTGSANANVDAVATAGGDVVVNTALADDVVATTTGTGSVTVTGEGDTAMTVTGRTITVNLQSADAVNNATVTATGTGAGVDTDSLTVTSGDDLTIANQAADVVESITVTSSAAVDATITTSAATTYSGNSTTTFLGDHAMFEGATVSGGAKLEINAMNADTDVSKATGSIELSATAVDSTGDSILAVNNNANVKLSANQSNGLEINADDDTANTATSYLQGTLNLEVAAAQTDTIVIDPSAASTDGFDTINLTVSTVNITGLDLTTSAGTTGTTINVLGAKNASFDNSTTGKALNASALTGNLSAEATANLTSVTGGSGNDTLTIDAVGATLVVDAGAGNDSVDVGGDIGGTVSGGAGTDTLELTGGARDVSGATISGFEMVDLNNNASTVDEALLNNQAVVLESTGGAQALTITGIESSLDLSNLSFADSNVTITANFATGKSGTLGASSAVSITGSAGNDTFTGHNGADTLLGGAGVDSLTGGNGADVLDGGAGNDTTLAGGAGADTINGGAGNDTGIDGGGDNDVIDGGAGNDTMTGNTGDDTLTGGEGSDTITGADGADSIILTETTSAADIVIINTTSAGGGLSSDTISVAVAGNANNTGEDTITGFAFGTDTIRIVNTEQVAYVHGTDSQIGLGTATVAATGVAADYTTLTGLIDLDNDGDYADADDVAVTFATPNVAVSEARFEAALQYDVDLAAGGVAFTGGGLADSISSGTGADTITGGAGADTFEFLAAGDGLNGNGLTVGNNDGANGAIGATDTIALTANADVLADFDEATGDKLDLSAFSLTGAATLASTGSSTATDHVADGKYALVTGTLAGTTLTVGGTATHTAVFFDADTTAGVDTEVVLVADVITAADLILA